MFDSKTRLLWLFSLLFILAPIVDFLGYSRQLTFTFTKLLIRAGRHAKFLITYEMQFVTHTVVCKYVS